MHPLNTHTSSQLHAFPKGQASPGERASAGWAVRGEFSSISSPQSDTGWWPPGGEKGLDGVAGDWGRGSSGLEGSLLACSLPALPVGSDSWGWWSRAGSSSSSSSSSSSASSSSSISSSPSLTSSHSSSSPSSSSSSSSSPWSSSPWSSGGRWAGAGVSGSCGEHKASQREGGGPEHPHTACPEMSRPYLCGRLLGGSGLWCLGGWGLCLLGLPAVIVVTGEVRGKGREAAGHGRKGLPPPAPPQRRGSKFNLGEKGVAGFPEAAWRVGGSGGNGGVSSGVRDRQWREDQVAGAEMGGRGGDRGATSGETGPNPPQTKGLTHRETSAPRHTNHK